MKVIVAVTKTCRHCPILEKELMDMGITYKVQHVEDHPELVKVQDTTISGRHR